MPDKTDDCCETTSGSSSSFFWLLAGVAVGAAAAVLLAPKSGRETRDQLGGWWRNTREKLRFNREPEDLDSQRDEDLVEA